MSQTYLELTLLSSGDIAISTHVPPGEPEVEDSIRVAVGESFGGYTYDELRAIANVNGVLPADKLRV